MIISVNLLTYNAEKYIRACLGSVLAQSYPDIHILIIDNHSQDKTVKEIYKILDLHRRDSIHLIKNKKNIGFAAAHNQGIKESQGEVVLCLNQDVVLDKDFIKNAVALFQINNKIGSVQGKLLRWRYNEEENIFKKTHTIDSAGLMIFKNRRIINRGQGKKDRGQYENQEEIFGVDGAAPLYRRTALEDVKIRGEYFDESFFMYKEDVDLAWRMRLAGWPAVYAPQSLAWHCRGSGESATKNILGIIRERKKLNPRAKYLAFKNQRLTQVKNELPWLFFRHLFYIFPKEIFSWLYVIFFEFYTWRAIKDLFMELPAAWRKRKIIMARKRVSTKEIAKWFQ